MHITVFIPTYNALSTCHDVFIKNLAILQNACNNDIIKRVLVVDSSSTDATLEAVKNHQFDYHVIPKIDFDHGETRNIVLRALQNLINSSNGTIIPEQAIILYLTQDVLLHDESAISHLVAPLVSSSDIASCYGRQLPHANANVFAKYLRYFNYPNVSYVRSYDDRYVYGVDCAFSSDSFCAYRVSALIAIGGFPKHIIFGEDVFVAARFLQTGYKIAYNANAICYHSHNYTLKQSFHRYFDIGVFHRSNSWILQEFGTVNKKGIKFMLGELSYLKSRIWLWPVAFASFFAKYLGYKLGSHYDLIGVRMCRKLTTNKAFWW